MKARSKTEITVETHRTLTIKRAPRYRLAWCEECGKHRQMATAEDAATLVGVSPRVIYRLIEARELHFVDTADRMVFVCLNSLEDLSRNRRCGRFWPDP